MIINEQQEGISTGQFSKALSEVKPRDYVKPKFWSETVPAAFRLDNEVASYAVSEAIKQPEDDYDPNYYALDDLGEYAETEYAEPLARARNKSHMDALKLDIEREKRDGNILEQSDYGLAARVMAGIFSPTTLLPAGGIIKGAKGISVARSALSGAAVGTGSMAISESLLQQSQITRTPEESLFSMAGGTVLGGVLGGFASSLSRAEFDGIATKLEQDFSRDVDITPTPELNNFLRSASAAEAEKATLQDLTIAGKGALSVSRASRFLNPFNRLANSPFVTARKALLKGFETTTEFNLHRDGKTLGAAAETEMKGFEAYNAYAVQAIKEGFAETKQFEKSLGRNITATEYRERLARALRNGDFDSEVDAISKAAQRIRKEVLEPIKQRAIDSGLLPKDVEAKFAKSYLHRRWNREKLIAYEPEAKQMLREWASAKLAKLAKIDNSKKQIGAPEVELGKIRLYRGLEQPFDKNYNSSLSDAPQGYSTWTDNPDLAREYAGKNGFVYYTDLPKNKLGKELIDQDGERALFVDNEKPAGLRGIKGKEFLLYTEHDDYRAQNIKEFLDSSGKSLNSGEIQTIVSRIEQAIGDAGSPQFKQSVDEAVDEVYDTLTGVNSDSVPSYISPITRGALKEKLLDIDDNIAEPFLDNDAGAVINSYISKIAADISLTRAFGRADMKQVFDDLAAENRELVAKAKTPKERQKLKKQYHRAKRDLEAMRDLMRGHFNKSDPDSLLVQGGIALRDVTYSSTMGGVLAASLGDVFRHVMMQGITKSFGDMTDAMQLPKHLAEMRLDDLKEAGIVIERIMASRLSTLADIHDPLARGSMLTRFTGSMAQGFSKLTLINHWNDLQKGFAATMTQNRVMRGLTGEADETTYLRYLGIDEGTGAEIIRQFKKHGEKDGNQFIVGLKSWDDTPQAREAAIAFKAALKKEADTVVVTKSIADAPIYSNTPLGRLLFQFTGYLFGAHQRMLLRGMQKADMATLLGATMMVGMGTVVAAMKQKEYELSAELTGQPISGKKLAEWDRKKFIYEGVDRSGLLGIIGDFNNRYEKMGGTGITRALGIDETSRYSARGKLDVWAGAGLGKLAGASSLPLALMSGKEPSDSEIAAFRRAIPFQNITGLRFLFDEVQGNITE